MTNLIIDLCIANSRYILKKFKKFNIYQMNFQIDSKLSCCVHPTICILNFFTTKYLFFFLNFF